MKYEREMDWKLIGGFFLILLIYIPAVFLNDLPQVDVAFRYAPAAEAFARGDWAYAYHPRLQMLHPTVSGIFSYLFGINGFTASKLSSFLFYALGIFPLFYLLKEVFNKKIAYWGILAYTFGSRLLPVAYSGLRDSHKQFCIILLTLGLVLVYKYWTRLKGYFIFGIACGLSVCTRNDLLLFSMVLFGLCGIFDSCRNKFPWRSMVGCFTAVIFSLPEFLVNYSLCKMLIDKPLFIPGERVFDLFYRLFRVFPTFENVAILFGVSFVIMFLIVLPVFGWILRLKYGKWAASGCVLLLLGFICYKVVICWMNSNEEMISDFVQGVIRGVHPILFGFLLPGLLYRIFWKKFTSLEKLLLSVFLLHGILILAQILLIENKLYISSRYLLPAVPLYFGWIGFTALIIWRLLGKIPVLSAFRTQIACLLLTGCLIYLFVEAYYPVINLYGKGKHVPMKRQVYAIAKVIKDDYKGEKYSNHPFFLDYYFPNACPLVLFTNINKTAVAAYLAGGNICVAVEKAQYVVAPVGIPLPLEIFFEKIGEPIPGKKSLLQIWRRR